MSGKEFTDRILKIPKVRNEYDENGYFRNQINHLAKVKEIHTWHLVECMIGLSEELIQKDLDMIDHIDDGYLGKETFI